MHRLESKVSSKGQVVIPKELRQKYGLEEGKTVVFEDVDGCIKLLPKTLLREIELDVDIAAAEKDIEKMRRQWREY